MKTLPASESSFVVHSIRQWDLPIEAVAKCSGGGQGAQKLSAQALAALKPKQLGLLHTLPHSVTTFTVCPVPVGVSSTGELAPLSRDCKTPDAVSVIAAVTAAGNVELITVGRGSLTPLMGTISVSLGTFAGRINAGGVCGGICGG